MTAALFDVLASDRDTGKDINIRVEADSPDEAMRSVMRDGWMVASARPVPSQNDERHAVARSARGASTFGLLCAAVGFSVAFGVFAVRYAVPILDGGRVYLFASDNAVAETANILADVRAGIWVLAGLVLASIGVSFMKR